MKRRTRRRHVQQLWQETNGSSIIFSGYYKTPYQEFTDPVVKPGPCEHIKIYPGSATYIRRTDPNYIGTNLQWVCPLTTVSSLIAEAIAYEGNRLDRTHLPTSSEQNLLMILAEIDDTIDLFTKKFLNILSYGSLKWGFMPFVQELIACARSVQNLASSLSGFRYTDQRTITYTSREYSANTLRNVYLLESATIKLRRNGSGDISEANSLNKILDRLGLHPDLATLYDLAPGSFILDWVLPIGNYLESMRGWVSSMKFTGWSSVKANGKIAYVNNYDNDYWQPFSHPIDFSYYKRNYDTLTVLTSKPDTDLSLRRPSTVNLIDMIYLLGLPKLKIKL